MFKEGVGLNYSQTRSKKTSTSGVILSFLVILPCLVYLMQNALILYYRERTLFTTSTEKQKNFNRVFTEQDGFQIAIAVPDFTPEETEEYYQDMKGRKLEEWITIEANFIKCTFDSCDYTDLELHKCTDEELGLDDKGNSKFYPTSEQDKKVFLTMKSIFMCFDQS